MTKLALIRKTNIRFMKQYKVEKQYISYYQKTFLYQRMMLGIAWVEMWKQIGLALISGFRKGNK